MRIIEIKKGEQGMKRCFFRLCCGIIVSLFMYTSYTAELAAAPVESDKLELLIKEFDDGTIIQEQPAWLEQQENYSLIDAAGNEIAYVSSVGQDTQGMLNLLLMRIENSSSNLYKNEYRTAVGFALEAFSDNIDAETICNDFENAYKEKASSEFSWENTYDDTNIVIKMDESSPAELNITLYNSEKYNPFLQEGDLDDYAEKNPLLQIMKITREEFQELADKEGERSTFSPDMEFYKITVQDNEYHKDYKIDLQIFVAINPDSTNEKFEYAYVIQNNASEMYSFPYIQGWWKKEEKQISGVLNIPICEKKLSDGSISNERFHYAVQYDFELDDPQNVTILIIE